MYKRNDYIAFMTKKPEVHLNVMFGHNDLTEDDFEAFCPFSGLCHLGSRIFTNVVSRC